MDLINPINDARFYESLIKDPRRRTDEDVRNIFEKLRGLDMFAHLFTGPLTAICRSARYERHPAHHILFRKEQKATCWYILLSGSVLIESHILLPYGCFGKRNGLSCRRATDCICLQTSEMIVIDYPDVAQQNAAPPPPSGVSRPIVQAEHRRRMAPPPPAPQSEASAPPPAPPPRPPRQPAPPRPSRGLPRTYPMDFPMDVPTTSKTQVFVNGAGDDDTLVRVKHRRQKSGSMGSVGSSGGGRAQRIRSTASSSTGDGDELWPGGGGGGGGGAGTADGDVSEDEDDESVPSHDGYHELKDSVRECLEKEPSERNSEDVAVLLDFMQHMSAFASLPVSIKRQLCLKMVFAVVPDAGTVVMQNNEKIDAWAVIVNGCVEVVKPSGERVEFKLGDSFGCEAVNSVQYHTGDMRTMVDDCEFVLVEHRDFCSIMSTIGEHIERGRDEATGEVVSEIERRAIGAQVGLVLIKAKPDKLVSHLVEERDGQVDANYIDDFLLTYRVFIHDPVMIFEKLMHWFAEPQYRDRVARIVLLWVNNHYNDFETNREMVKLLERFEQALERDQMYAQQTLLNLACSVKARVRSIKYARRDKDEPMQFSVIGGKEMGAGIFVSDVLPDSAAEEAGLKRADEILEVNDQTLKFVTLQRAIDLLKGSIKLQLVVKNNINGFKELIQKHDKADAKKNHFGPMNGLPHVIPVKGVGAQPNNNTHSKAKMNGNKGYMDKLFTMIRSSKDIDAVDSINEEQFLNLLIRASDTTTDIVRASKSNPDLLSAISSFYGPPKTDSPEHVLKIYRADQTFKYLPVFKETTAQNVVQLALQEFSMTAESGLEWALCEVTVCENISTENTSAKNPLVIKQRKLPPQLENLAERISLNSRYYLKNNNRSEPLVPDDLASDVIKEAHAHILSLNAQVLAAQLTLQDFSVFASIEPTEYVDSLFKLESRYGWPRLDEFETVFNREMWWVATEVCRERSTQRRAKLVKKFIKVARHCRDLRNFNSMFAIVSGLDKPAVRRLHNTWERVGGKYSRFLEEIHSLIDPSRNMSKYRQHLALASQEPPVVPIFPVIKKDLTFLHEGNPTYTDKLVNFDKLRMIAREVRRVNKLSSAPYEIGSMAERSGGSVNDALLYMNSFDNGTGTVATMRKGNRAGQPRKKVYEQALMVRKVKAYLSGLDVIENEHELDGLSLEAEPAPNTQKFRRAPSPTPSSISSHSTGSDQKRVLNGGGTKFGIDSPQAVQKMLALVQNSRVKSTSSQASPASSSRSIPSRTTVSARSSAGSGMLRMSRGSLAENGGLPQRAVDLNRETSAVTNIYEPMRSRPHSLHSTSSLASTMSNFLPFTRSTSSSSDVGGGGDPDQTLRPSWPHRQTPSPSPCPSSSGVTGSSTSSLTSSSSSRRPLSHPSKMSIPASASPSAFRAFLVGHRPVVMAPPPRATNRMHIIQEGADNQVSRV